MAAGSLLHLLDIQFFLSYWNEQFSTKWHIALVTGMVEEQPQDLRHSAVFPSTVTKVCCNLCTITSWGWFKKIFSSWALCSYPVIFQHTHSVQTCWRMSRGRCSNLRSCEGSTCPRTRGSLKQTLNCLTRILWPAVIQPKTNKEEEVWRSGCAIKPFSC